MNHTEILAALCELTARERVDFLPLAPDSRPLSDYPPITKYLLDLKNGAKPESAAEDLSREDWQHLTSTFTFGSGDSKAELDEIIRQSLALWS
jgi:hypothetical protein